MDEVREEVILLIGGLPPLIPYRVDIGPVTFSFIASIVSIPFGNSRD
jgi:hypothetical protein